MASLPGLNFSSATPPPPAAQTTRTEDLPANAEYRFEAPFAAPGLRVRLVSGTAELFGTELAPGAREPYAFAGTKAAIFTHHGCRLELAGPAESEYVAEETAMPAYANAHFALEAARERARAAGGLGPRALLVGPEGAGKTSVAKILTAYAARAGEQPLVVNLDPRQGMLGVPGALTAAAFAGVVDVEEGWGSSPISGPSPVPVKMPLVYHLGVGAPDEAPRLFRPLVTRMALAVTSRLEEDPALRVAGFVIDTPGSISGGKGGQYESISHIVSEFSVNVVFVLGSERLYNDLSRRFANKSTDEAVTVVKLDKSGGCVDRDESYMNQLRQQQIRAYFFGRGGVHLSPHTHWEDFSSLAIYRIIDSSQPSNLSFLPGLDEDEYKSAPSSLYEKVTPTLAMQNCLLAVTNAEPGDTQENIRDSSILGYVCVGDVDEAKKKVRLLSPMSGRIPPRALVLGRWPEPVADLVS